MTAAIVILNYNGEELLPRFLPTVIANTPQEIGVYIVDNASTDNSISWVEKHYPRVNYVLLGHNHGFAKGYNLGLKEIKADIYCLLNSDVEVTEGWTVPVLDRFRKNLDCAVIQPKIRDAKKKDFFEYAGAAGGFWDNLGYPYCDGRLFWTLEKDTGQYNQPKKIGWATGACFWIRSEDFWDSEGFDSDFFAHQEEIDLCWRLQNNGKQVWYEPLSTVYHLGGGTLKTNAPQKTFLNFRNNLCVLAKNLPLGYFAVILLPRLILDGISAFVFLRYNGWRHFFAVLRAHFSFYGLLPKMLQKRKGEFKIRNRGRFIVLTYFLLRKRKCKFK